MFHHVHAQVVPAAVNENAYLGMAYDSDAKKFKNIRCINGSISQVPDDAMTNFESELDLSYAQLKNYLSGTANAGASFPSISIQGETNFLDKAASDELSNSFVFDYKTIAFSTVLRPPANASLAISDACSFDPENPVLNGISVERRNIPDYIGDSWLRAIRWGGSLNIVFKIKYSSKYDKELFKGSLSIGTGEYLSLDGELSDEQQRKSASVTIQIMAVQRGGSPTGLFNSVPTEILSCDFTNVSECISTYNGMVDYATQEFEKDLATASADNIENVVPIDYVVDSYSGTFAQLSPVSRWEDADEYLYNQIITALEQDLQNTLEDIRTTKNILQSEMIWTVAYRTALSNLLSELESNKLSLAEAQGYCLGQPDFDVCNRFVTDLDITDVDITLLDPPTPSVTRFTPVYIGSSVFLEWEVENASSCKISWQTEFGRNIAQYGSIGSEKIDLDEVHYIPGKKYLANLYCVGYDNETIDINLPFSIDKSPNFSVVGSEPMTYYSSNATFAVKNNMNYRIYWNVPGASTCTLEYYHTSKYGGLMRKTFGSFGSYELSANNVVFYYGYQNFHSKNKHTLTCKNSANKVVFQSNKYLFLKR